MAKLIGVEKPKVWAIETNGKDGFSITFTQRITCKLSTPIGEGETYYDENTLKKEKMTPIHTNEYKEIEAMLEGGRIFAIIMPPKEE